ncbi:MAG: HAD family phosphatase [Acidobacteria bacterium]|nr:MAG: HAD family phosphatase [Acidobacteriota bacterium]
MSSKPMCKGVIFDMDGVLIDSHPIHKKVWAQFLASLNKQVTEEELDFVLEGRKREEILRHFLGDLSAELVTEYGKRKNMIYEETSSELKTICGVEEFLGALESAGIPMAVATSASFVRARNTLAALGILPRFAAVVTGNDVVNGKPDPEVFVRAAERLNQVHQDLLVVEDAVSGVMAAKSAGMKCLGIAADGRSEKLRAAGADRVIPNYREFGLLQIQQLF